MNKFIFIIIFFSISIFSQDRKSIEAYRFESSPVIDGKLNELEWSNINPATDFVIFKPSTRYGKKIPSEYLLLF